MPVMLKPAVFCGPTLNIDSEKSVDLYPPAVLGSIFRAVEAGYKKVLLIDGYFGLQPAVWHKEILFAISHGVSVVGASSIGALRAAELWQFGMVGVGEIFRLYRAGVISADDEVCLVHGAEELNFINVSYPLINLRLSLRDYRRHGHISKLKEARIAQDLGKIHFSLRTKSEVNNILQTFSVKLHSSNDENGFWSYYRDQKLLDARMALNMLPQTTSRIAPTTHLVYNTDVWRTQFEKDIEDVPKLLPAGA